MLKNIKKITISLIAIFLVVGVACTTFATDGQQSILDEINEMLQEENQIVEDNETLNEIPEGANNNTTTTTNTTNNTIKNTNVNENLPTTTPHAGLEDYSGLVFIVIFAVSAIYAYKKVKNYNA